MAEFDIFISYRRVGGFETAKHLYDLLRHDGYTVSFDIDTLREGKFNVALLSRIKMCQDFVLIVDPHTFDRTLDPSFDPEQDWLRQELSYALSLQKNVIPILLAGASFPDKLPDDICDVRYMNGPGYSKDYFDAFYNKLKWLLHSKPRNNTEDILELSEPERIQENRAEIHIETDADCSVYRFAEKLVEAKAGKDNVIHLSKGKHNITLISNRFSDIEENIVLDIPSKDYSDIVSIKMHSRELERIHFYLVEKNGKYGFTNKTGEVVIPIEYESAYDFSEGLAGVKKNGKYGYIDKTGEVIIPFEYDGYGWTPFQTFDSLATDFKNGLARIKKNGKWGFINRTGEVVIPVVYDEAEDFSDNIVHVKKNNKWGFIDKTGKEIVPFIYEYSHNRFKEGLLAVYMVKKSFLFGKSDGWGFIDESGNVAIPFNYDLACVFSGGLACVKKNGKCGYIDKKGHIAIDFKYDDAEDFEDGLARVQLNGKFGCINTLGEEVIPPIYNLLGSKFRGFGLKFKDGLTIIKKNEKYGFVDKTGHINIPMIYDDADAFHDGLAGVKKDGKYGYVNTSGKVVIPFTYDFVGDFSDGLAYVRNNEKYGYINKTGGLVIPLVYDRAGIFIDGLAPVKRNGKYGYIDTTGHAAIPLEYDFIDVNSQYRMKSSRNK